MGNNDARCAANRSVRVGPRFSTAFGEKFPADGENFPLMTLPTALNPGVVPVAPGRSLGKHAGATERRLPVNFRGAMRDVPSHGVTMKELVRSAKRGLAMIVVRAVARCAAAQTNVPVEAPKFEVWGAMSAALTGPSGEWVSSYSPPLLLDGPYTSHGAQTVTFGADSGVGFEAGANVFVAPHAGIQFLFHRDSPEISGVNTPYDTALQYTSRPPPDNLPVPVDIHQSTPWPDTTGSLTRTDASVNGVVRMGSGKVSATVSGGLTFERVSGTMQPLAYTTYRLGGHSVLFEDDFLLAASLEPTNAVGFNAGGDVCVSIHRGVALMVGYRYRGGPAIDMPVRITKVINADQILFEQTIAEISQQLAPRPARVDLSGSRVVMGLKLMR